MNGVTCVVAVQTECVRQNRHRVRLCWSTDLYRSQEDVTCLRCGKVYRIVISNVDVGGQTRHISYIGARCKVPKA